MVPHRSIGWRGAPSHLLASTVTGSGFDSPARRVQPYVNRMGHAEMAGTVRELSGVIFEFGEAKLVNAAKLGDRDAAEQLVERTYSAVYAALYRMCHGDAELAADLTQDTYRKAWESLAGFDCRSKLSTWLYRIAYTTFLNHVRRPDRSVELDEGSIEVSDPAPSLEETIGKSEE